MTMNGYLSEGHRTAKDVISTIVHTSCNSRQGNKCRQQSAPKLEALSRLTYTHPPTMGTIKPCILIRQSRSN